MAPTTIETVTVVRPLKVFAFICGLIVILLMILCLASSNWLVAHKFRQGLWEQCVEEDAPLPLPFGLNVKPGCYVARTVGQCRLLACLNSMEGNGVPRLPPFLVSVFLIYSHQWCSFSLELALLTFSRSAVF